MKNQNIIVLSIPILAALVPVAYLAAANIDQIDYRDISRSIIFSIVIGIFLLIASAFIFRNIKTGVLIATFTVFLLASYGHVYNWLEVRSSFLGHHSILLIVYFVAALLFSWFVVKIGLSREKLLTPVGWIVIALFLYSGVPVTFQLIKYQIDLKQIKNQPQSNITRRPDVYFIILDAYARQDVLNSKFDFSNSAFVSDLSDYGFFVSSCSQSNYQITMLSILSTLKMDYLIPLPEESTDIPLDSDIEIVRDDIIHNPVRESLESMGYKTVSFESAYPWSETPDVDVFYDLDLSKKPSVINKFESTLLNSTIYNVISEVWRKYSKPDSEIPIDMNSFDESAEFYYLVHRNTLDNLDEVTSIAGPKYVYSHLGAPHEPYVFTADGSYIPNGSQAPDAYVEQLKYINKRVLQIIEKILKESTSPPIIVLESDHGIDPNDKNTRMKNFMAFYVPPEIRNQLYPTMTPVNSFRLVLNYLDGGNRPLIPDLSFYSPNVGEVDFELVENTCQP